MAIVELADAEAQLRLQVGSEDNYIQSLIDSAIAACQLFTGRYVDQADIPADSGIAPLSDTEFELMRHAVLLTIAAFYGDREGRDGVPPVVSELLRPLRSMAR